MAGKHSNIFDKNLEKLATYVASINVFGGEMTGAVAILEDAVIPMPDDLDVFATCTEERIWEHEISQYVKKNKKWKTTFPSCTSLFGANAQRQ